MIRFLIGEKTGSTDFIEKKQTLKNFSLLCNMTGSGDMPPPPSYEEATKNLPPSAYPLGHQQPYHGQPAYDGHAQYPTYASGDQPPYPSGGQPSYPSGVQPPYASEGGQPPYASENQPLYPSGGQPYYPSGRQPLYPNRNQPMYPSGHPQYPSAVQGTYPYQPPPIQYSSRQPDQ
ncbi:hypothetical protein EGW08_012204, partial [Elysia chlorotica]